MGPPPRKPALDDFLAWANGQPERNEHLRGEVFAVARGRVGDARMGA